MLRLGAVLPRSGAVCFTKLRLVAENWEKRGFISGHRNSPPTKHKKQTKILIPAAIEQFLADAVSQAQRAADEAVAGFEDEQQPSPFLFDSVEEWHAFDAVLERWLQR